MADELVDPLRRADGPGHEEQPEAQGHTPDQKSLGRSISISPPAPLFGLSSPLERRQSLARAFAPASARRPGAQVRRAIDVPDGAQRSRAPAELREPLQRSAQHLGSAPEAMAWKRRGATRRQATSA